CINKYLKRNIKKIISEDVFLKSLLYKDLSCPKKGYLPTHGLFGVSLCETIYFIYVIEGLIYEHFTLL
ncbi:MAG: hypothetical protein KBD31_00190, partial [Proteobacteria bacterium]|nr:hypothetical protein [Pseudomonadota bacterium]